MERNTKTTVGNLQPGDRFYFISDSKRLAYQLMEFKGSYGAYNIVNEKGGKRWQYDKMSSATKEIIFLRHTINQN